MERVSEMRPRTYRRFEGGVRAGSDAITPVAATVWSVRTFTFILVSHAFLGFLLRGSTTLTTLYALLVGLFALYVALRDPTPERTYLMMGYIVGSEILWRMTKADIFWMYADYLVILLSIVMIMRFRPAQVGIKASVLYMLLLLMAVPIAFASYPFEIVRRMLAFNMAGPVAFGVSVYSASRLRINRDWLVPIAFATVLPIISIAVLATSGIVAGGVVFSGQSNYAASAGYAPNQVSTLMSYAAVVLFVLIVMRHEWSRYKWVFLILMVYLSAQGILTFSRGGLLNTLAFLLLFLPFLLRDRTTRKRLLGLAIVLVPILTFVVMPEIEHITGTVLEQRYATSGTTTGRSRIMAEELGLFMENPILGVGPGMSVPLRFMRADTFKATTHTEYTRLLAEHGVVGAIAFMFFLVTYLSLYSRARYPRAQGFVLAVLGWTLTMFVHAATRTMTFAFLTVLSVLWVHAETDRDKTGDER